MARRRKSSFSNSNKGQGAVIIGVVLIALIIFIIKIILILLPFAIAGYLIYLYLKWQEGRLEFYNNDWKLFWKSELKNKLLTVLAVLISLIGIVILPTRPIVGLIIIVSSLMIYPKISELISNKYNEKYNSKTKGMIAGVLLLIGSLFNSNYQAKEDVIKQEQLVTEAKEKKRIEDRELKIQATKDSALTFFDLGQRNASNKNYSKAMNYIDTALQLNPECEQAIFEKGKIYTQTGKYQDALNQFDKVAGLNITSDDLHFAKAICYIKQGNSKNSLDDLKISADLGNKEAEKLYKKYAPKPKPEKSYSSSNRSSRGCSYNGHQLFIGSRGGCYYYSGSSKQYVDRSNCSGCY
jgi:tetratricopeptide (TPR) repeat protein